MNNRRKVTYARKAASKARPVAVRKAPALTGYGAYKKRAAPRRVARAPAPAPAPSASESIGRQIGGFLGDLAQKGVKMLTGFGDYAEVSIQPKRNSIMDQMLSNGPPAIINSSDRSVIVRHREYLGDIITGNAGVFTIQGFPINPGLNSTFPWLSQIAANFQEWRPHGIVFEFKSTSADSLNSTNTALGTVIMATDYDPTDLISGSFQNKQMMQNHEFASSARQSCSMLHPIECASDKNPLSVFHVRTGAEPPDADVRNTDLGIFAIATSGQQGNAVNIGELWVSYEIEFLKPQMISGVGLDILSLKAFNTGATTSAYFGTLTALQIRPGSILGCTFTNTEIIFPPLMNQGLFLFIYHLQGSSTASVVAPTVTPTNIQFLQFWQNGVNSTISAPLPTSTSQIATLAFVLRITGQGARLTFSSGTLPTGNNMDLLITEWNGGILT